MITYITVHGTGDGERPDDGGERQWWRADSDFATELLAQSPPGLSGMVAMGFLVCAAFFGRFWSRTKDPLFMAFAIAFLLLAANQALATTLGAPQQLDEHTWVYLLRFCAFSLLIGAILTKNFSKK